MSHRIRLHHILFIAFTVISSVPVLFLAAWVQHSALNKEIASVEEKHLLLARNLMGGLARYAVDTEGVFRLVSAKMESDASLEGYRDILKTLYFKHVLIINSHGQIKKSIDPYRSKPIKHIASATFISIKDFFNKTNQDPAKVIFTDLIRDSKGDPTLYLVRYLSEKHYAIGALSTEYFSKVQKTISFGRRGHAAIVDKHGRAIAHPVAQWRDSMKDMSFLPPVTLMKQGKTGVSQFFTPAMQADMIAGYTAVPGVGWGVMIPQPFEELEERAADVRIVATGITLLGIAIAGLISWYIALLLARPIEAVAQSASSMLHDKKVPSVSIKQKLIPHELRELMTSYNGMVEEIQEKTAAIKETANRLTEAQRIAHIGNWEWDIGNNKLWCSEETYRIANIDTQNFNGKIESLVKVIHHDDRDEFENLLLRCEKYGKRFVIEHRILLPDNSERYVHHEAEIKTQAGTNSLVMIGIIHDVTERKLYENKLFNQANYDELTGLPNRTLLFDRLTQTTLFANRNNLQVAVLNIDLDNFKEVNDTHGHIFGDKLLQQAAKRLETCIRQSDTLARLSGDEFTIILKEINHKSDATIIAEKIISCLGTPFKVDNIEIFLGTSVGITIYPHDSENTVNILRNADIALFRAKETGKNTFCFFTEEMNKEVINRNLLCSDLRKALENNEFEVYYQPIIDLASGKITGAEALLRWFHPLRGAISPFVFIPLAEETGIITSLGEWVLQQACQQAASWKSLFLDTPRISVNLSLQQLKLGFKKEKIIQILQLSELSAEQLTFEITESMIMEDSDKVINWMNDIRQLGINFSIDDFGTGYSSLSYLKRLPVDILKIDRSFIKDINEPDDAALVEAIIAISKSLGLCVVAEGVENSKQLEFLRRLHCHRIQGYFYSKPVPADEFIEFQHNWYNHSKAN